METVVKVLAGFFIGGFLGWLTGIAWYELVEVPKAASMSPMTAPTHLCAAGNALSYLAVPGAILGAIVGARRDQAGVRGENQDQPQYFI